MVDSFFLKVATMAGGSTDAKHVGDFDVTAYEFDLSALISAQTGDTTKTFQPFVVDLTGTLGKGVTELLTDAAAGIVVPSAVFSARKAGATVDYETITLTNMRVLGYDMASGGTGRLALGYDAIDIAYKPQKLDGTLDVAQHFTYDLASNGLTVAPLPATGLDPVLKPDASLRYFLKVGTIEGESTDAKHLKEIDVTAYEFELDALIANPSGGTAKVFQPFVVDLTGTIGKGVTELLSAAAAGTVIPNATFSVRKATETADFETVTLTNVRVLGYDMASGNGGRLSLGYDAIDVAYKLQKLDGTFEAAQHFTYDLAANGLSVAPLLSTGLDPVLLPDASNKYFLKVGTIEGESTDAKHVKEFDVTAYEFELDALIANGSGGATKAFQPFVVDLAGTVGKGVTELLADAAGGVAVPTAIFSVRKLSGSADFETITLTNVHVLGYDMASGSNGRLSLGYDAIDIAYKPQKLDGTLDVAQHFTYDLAASGFLLDGTSHSDMLFGSGYGDTINGNAGDDSIDGFAGNDTVFAGAGHDIVRGGIGNDTLVGNADIFAQEPDILEGGQGVGGKCKHCQSDDRNDAHHRASTFTRALGASPIISGAYIASTRLGGKENSPTLFRRTVYSILTTPLGKYS